jgi:zinc and cadmium transporter
MTLLAILLGTLAAGIGSVWLAAALSFGVLARYTQHMLSLAAGALLGTAFLHLLPEAFESEFGAHELFLTLLVGLIFFFLLDKAELWHHGHEHHHPAPEGGSQPHAHHTHHEPSHSHDHRGHEHRQAGGGWAVLVGDSVHCFGDGILIASAFMADLDLGIIAALAVLAHEVPHHMGDLAVLRAASGTRKAALLKVTLAGAITALGGLVGYWLIDLLRDYLTFFLVVAASSFIYVALADLIPQLQRRLSLRETCAQIAWLLVGISLVMVVARLAHAH